MSEPTLAVGEAAGTGEIDVAAFVNDAAAAYEGGTDNSPASTTPADSGNPAWKPILDALPDSLHETVRPQLEAWDRDVQTRFDTLRSEQNQYTPWREFIDSGVDPDTATYAIQLLNEIATNPRAIYDTLGQRLGLTPQQVEQAIQEGGDPSEEEYTDPRFQQLEEGFRTLAELQLQQQQAAQQAAEDQALEAELTAAREKHGEFDEDFVLEKLSQGATMDQALEAWQTLVERIRGGQTPSAPVVLGGGGAVPAPSQDVTQLTSKQTRGLVADILRRANQS